jgi:hypothetical protein
MKNAFVISILIILFISCKDPNSYEVFESNWQNCRVQYNKTETFQKMLGRWKLIGNSCGRCTNSGYKKTDKNVEIIISQDSVLKTYENEKLLHSKTFSMVGYSNEKSFTIQLAPPYEGNIYTYGVIEFCDNTIAFKSSYVDGEDFFFNKIK